MKKISERIRNERAARLKSIRNAKGVTMEQFAENLKISKEGYQKIESGENNISLDMLQKCRDNMGISADYLLYGDHEDGQNVWNAITNCQEKTKLELFLRLFYYFGYQKEPVYTEKISIDKLIRNWINNIEKE